MIESPLIHTNPFDQFFREILREELPGILNTVLGTNRPIRDLPVTKTIEQPKIEPLRVNIKELAKRIGRSERTLAEWKRLHIIPFEKIGRNLMFDVAAVDAALKKYRRNAAGD